MKMKFLIVLLVGLLFMFPLLSSAQCSICTRTAQQLGEKPAESLNFGILYLAIAPLALGGFIAYKWMKRNG